VSSLPPPPAAPFPSAPIEPGRARGGCGRAALIGCGVAAIVVLILFAIFVFYARRKPEVLTDLMMGQIERNLAPDVTAEDKQRLREAYAGFRLRVQERRVGPEPMERLRAALSSATRGAIGPEKVRELTAVFQEATLPAGSAPTPAGPAPVPALSPTP